MESFTSAVCLLTPTCYMASVHLQDAFYSVTIIENYHEHLSFFAGGTI